MNRHISLFALVVATLFLLSTPASAGVLYDNGLVNGGQNGYSGIYWGLVVSDSFTLAGTSTVTGVNLVISTFASTIPEYLYWRITDTYQSSTAPDPGTQALLTDVTKLCTGCKTISNTPGDTYSASFSLTDVVLGPGTYFLTLDYSNYLYWDVSNGPSQAFINGSNAQSADSLDSNSNSFQILGDGPAPAGVPEPASVAMLLSGLGLVAGLARRKMRA
jgi:hypothetical protein